MRALVFHDDIILFSEVDFEITGCKKEWRLATLSYAPMMVKIFTHLSFMGVFKTLKQHFTEKFT